MNSKRIELEKIQHAIDQYDLNAKKLLEDEAKLKIEREEFHKKEQEWNRAAKANAVIKLHFIRLEPELRGICRKGGIPWPFDSTLMAELSPGENGEH